MARKSPLWTSPKTSNIGWANSPHFCEATTGFLSKCRLWNARRNSVLTTRHYPDLSCASVAENLLQPIRSTTQIWVVTRHQYGMSALVSQTSFRGETRGSVVKYRLFSHATSTMVVHVGVSCFLPGSRVSLCRFENASEMKMVPCRSTVVRKRFYMKWPRRFVLRHNSCYRVTVFMTEF